MKHHRVILLAVLAVSACKSVSGNNTATLATASDGQVDFKGGTYAYSGDMRSGLPLDLPFAKFTMNYGYASAAQMAHSSIATASIDLISSDNQKATLDVQLIREYDQPTNLYTYCALVPVVGQTATMLGLQDKPNATGYMGIVFSEKPIRADQYIYASLYNFKDQISLKNCLGYVKSGAYKATFGEKQFTHAQTSGY